MGSYGAIRRGVDTLGSSNLAAIVNANIVGAPAMMARQEFGEINLLLDTAVILGRSNVYACIPDDAYTFWSGSSGMGSVIYTTVYTAAFVQICPIAVTCPLGTSTQTFTITETCTGNPNDFTQPAIPPHFTTELQVCEACEGKPTLTITCPESEQTGPNGGVANGGAASGGGTNGGSANGGAVANKNPAAAPGSPAPIQASAALSRSAMITAAALSGGVCISIVAWVL